MSSTWHPSSESPVPGTSDGRSLPYDGTVATGTRPLPTAARTPSAPAAPPLPPTPESPDRPTRSTATLTGLPAPSPAAPGPGFPPLPGFGGPCPEGTVRYAPFAGLAASDDAGGATSEGAAWLASTTEHAGSTLALWREHPTTPVVLSCGTAFDVVNAPAVFGRRMLDRLWEEGPGSGPAATYRGRVLLFTAPGTAARLPSLLHWEEWGSSGRGRAVPPLLCHGSGDAVTVPPPSAACGPAGTPGPRADSRWLVAPDSLSPWLPGPDVVLWACVRAARSAPGQTDQARPGGTSGRRVSISPGPDPDAKVYDVSRRR